MSITPNSYSTFMTDNFVDITDVNCWLLPDGVVDVLFSDAQKQEILRYQLIQKLLMQGYQLVCPPVIEFTESLLNNASEDLKRQTFKIIDQFTGRLMGVRADITPQILRIDAHHGGDGIARYCYVGHVIHTVPSALFGSRTPLQLGAEIFGCASIEADIELMNILFNLIKGLNLTAKLHFNLGHVAIFERLCLLASLSEYDIQRLMNLYANKALPELKQVCENISMGDDFYQLANFGHDTKQLMQVFSDNVRQDKLIVSAIVELERLQSHLQQLWWGDISVDVTELAGYHYHTGLVFNAYMNNEPQPLVRGGRFDGMNGQVSAENQPRPATGFSLDVTRLLAQVQLDIPAVVVVNFTDVKRANTEQYQSLLNRVDELRTKDYRVIIPLSQEDKPQNMTHSLFLDGEIWQLKMIRDV